MPEQLPQVSKLAGVLVEHQRFFEPLSTKCRQWVISNPQAAIALFNGAVTNRSTHFDDLLELVGELVKVPKVPLFCVHDKLEVDPSTELPLSYVGSEMRSYYRDLVEKDVPAATLIQHKLLKDSDDRTLIVGLGGLGLATIKMAHVFEFLKTANVVQRYLFYVVTANGSLIMAVDAHWHGRGWSMFARTADTPDQCRAGSHLVTKFTLRP